MAKGSKNGDSQNDLLRGIWNEMKALRASLDKRIDETNNRLDAVRHDIHEDVGGLGRRVVESEVRLATATTQLSGDVQALSGLIRDWREEHRSDRAETKVRLTRLEQHVGLVPKP